jgi:outer membrane lipoprotein-sorting protein
MMKKLAVIVMSVVFAGTAAAQEAQTASAFLDRVSEHYAGIKDYRANLVVRWPGRSESGVILYKAPNNIKITYSSPQDQVLVINNNIMQLYLPRYNSVMEQRLPSGEASPGMLTGNGLKILKENYSVSYINGPQLQPLAPGSNIMVYKLRLEWRVFSEGFRTLDLSIDRNLNIIRIEAVTSLFEKVQFDYSGITLNQNIPNAEFVLELEETNKSIKHPNFLFPTDN